MISATYSPEDNKLRLYPSARLDAETYARVQAAGFTWAPRQELFVAPAWTPEREDLALDLAGEIDAEEMSLAERAAVRAERFDAYAEKRTRDANAYEAAARRLADNIPLGQPILIGHHSERRARKDQERIRNATANAERAVRTANYWLGRASGAEWHARHKDSPKVRANRIDTLLAELRRLQRHINDAHVALLFWEKVTADEDIRRAAGNTNFAYRDAYFDLRSGKATPQEVRVRSIAGAEETIASPTIRRWIEHTLCRLAYERAQLGPVARFEGAITPVILQAFARTQGAEAPKVTALTLQSPVPLPLHMGDGSALTLDDAGWRDLMVACGYEVPAAKPKLAPILNLDAPELTTNDYGSRPHTYRVVHTTKAAYSKCPEDYRGTRYAPDRSFRFRIAMSRFVEGEGKGHDYVAVFFTDAKADTLEAA